jgi:hypothetical protein
MKLWYINIGLDMGWDPNDYRYEFKLRTRFISNYFSKQMRKKINWFETDGTFNMISVRPTPNTLEDSRLIAIDVLQADVHFDPERYEKIKGSPDCEYYLELLENGFRRASKFKEVPLDNLLELIENFRKNGCKNEWLHKKRRFKVYDIEVCLNCYFTTLDFKLVATIRRISTKEELCSGVVLRTDPDEVCFDRRFDDILIDGKYIIVTEPIFENPRIMISLERALSGSLEFQLLETADNDDD